MEQWFLKLSSYAEVRMLYEHTLSCCMYVQKDCKILAGVTCLNFFSTHTPSIRDQSSNVHIGIKFFLPIDIFIYLRKTVIAQNKDVCVESLGSKLPSA